MVERITRRMLKKGMKAWIVATERVQAGLAQLREELDDVVAEARHEYGQRAEDAADHGAEPTPRADANATRPKEGRSRSSRARTPRGAKTTEVAV